MNILILGGGGREHAISRMAAASPLCDMLFIAPGNAGTARCGQNVRLDPNNFDEVRSFVLQHQVGFVIVGPEDPVVNGISDYFGQDESLENVLILAPGAKGALLEGSKNFAKEFMMRHGIPTARYRAFLSGELAAATEYLENHPYPVVIKADGLAAGKGVVICGNFEEAKVALDDIFVKNKFGKAGSRVVIEEFLEGIELSVFILTDGEQYILLPAAKDYKRIGEGDTGLNTGGMGCVSPPPFADKSFMDKVESRIIVPTVQGLKSENISYRGFVFFGLMNSGGEPFVIEYNVRLGDPETEVILPRIDEDLLPVMAEAAGGNLRHKTLGIKDEYAAGVMLVSGGYPGDYEKGKMITGLEKTGESIVYHAGTTIREGRVVTSGGRVICITSLDKDLKTALEKSYCLADVIDFENKYFRRDLGMDLMKYV